MDTTLLETACRASGMLPSAIEDGLRRLQGHFEAHSSPTPELIAQQLLTLRETAPHLFPRTQGTDAAGLPAGVPPEVWTSLSPATKLSWAREHGHALQPVERRHRPLTLSSEQAAALAKMTARQRLDAYRALQAQQQQP